MSDENLTPTTPREVLLCRQAWINGRVFDRNPLTRRHDSDCVECIKDRSRFADAAAEIYPMPIVEVPRVVQCDGWEYKMLTDCFYTRRAPSFDWREMDWSPDVIRALAKLLADPTERKPADEVEQ